MAKLSARGRKCLVEVVREYNEEQLTAQAARHGFLDSDGKPLTKWERVTRRLMSDDKILQKRDVRFQPSPNCTWEDPRGRKHSYGWTVYGTLKTGLTADDFARIYRADTKSGKPSPWTVTMGSSGIPARVISQARIMRAINSGEDVGFCTSCGSEQNGVEPDASGYQCSACGQMAVTGAEQLLLETA
jgi:hypothetical protein